jgi:hypothetical protein
LCRSLRSLYYLSLRSSLVLRTCSLRSLRTVVLARRFASVTPYSLCSYCALCSLRSIACSLAALAIVRSSLCSSLCTKCANYLAALLIAYFVSLRSSIRCAHTLSARAHIAALMYAYFASLYRYAHTSYRCAQLGMSLRSLNPRCAHILLIVLRTHLIVSRCAHRASHSRQALMWSFAPRAIFGAKLLKKYPAVGSFAPKNIPL